MEIWEAIEKVSTYPDRHSVQMKYDLKRERIYELGALWTASLMPKSVLDVGCAYGTLDYILAKVGLNVTALDIMPELHSKQMFKELGVKFVKANIETDKIEGEYDAIVLTDVLEHLCYNPLPVLKKLAKICKKGIVISTPAKEVDYVCEGKWKDEVTWRQIPQAEKYEFVDGHHHTYYLWELQELLKEAGFIIVESQLLPVEATWMIMARKEA
jgi:2-polyprenyl-3-methyl-5-hydroxy-6-metoxy-1,4-benzoquinol methylase